MAIWSRHPGKKLTSVSPLPHPVRYHFLAQSALIKISGADFPLSYHCHSRAIWPHPSLSVSATPKSNFNPPVGQLHQHRIPHPKYCNVFHICAFQQTFSHLLRKSSYPLKLIRTFTNGFKSCLMMKITPGPPRPSNCHLFSNCPVLPIEFCPSACHLNL